MQSVSLRRPYADDRRHRRFPDGTTGSLTASYTFNTTTGKGTISYSYTLLDNTLGIPTASFAVVVTDRDGHSNPPGNLVISIVDDVPVARADTDAITPGQVTPETGNVLTGAGTTAGPAVRMCRARMAACWS